LKSDFSRLKRKLLFRALVITGIAFVLGAAIQFLLIDGVLEAPFADSFVAAYRALTGRDRYEAGAVYRYLFRNNKSELLMAGLLLLTVIVFYCSLSTLTRYFKEVSGGIEKLAAGTPNGIKLSPEMSFVEGKLNEVNTALRRRAEEAREAERRKDELVMYLAHDIKTPLTSVMGYLTLLADMPDLPPGQREKYIRIALDKANRLEQLAGEFFEITRYNSRGVTLVKTPVDIHYLLLQMAEEFYPHVLSAGKKIRVTSNRNLSVYADADKLARVFNNLLKNAVAYSGEGSLIEIIAERAGKRVGVMVKNRGPDIPKHELAAIFEKHRRLDAARGSSTGGAGLGLAIAKEIVELHGGEIRAESGGGTTSFTVLLPGSAGNAGKAGNAGNAGKAGKAPNEPVMRKLIH
jgi:two-component system sensor histidine kinase VanS